MVAFNIWNITPYAIGSVLYPCSNTLCKSTEHENAITLIAIRICQDIDT
jgi:hypothetical protein